MPTTTTGLATSFIQFSRPGATGGGATVTDSDGKIKWAGHNLLLNSESFDGWLSFAATVNANVTAAPNGTTTADKICEWTGTGAQTRYQTFTVGTAGSTFTLTVYAKKDERNFITVSLSDAPNTGWIAATFDLNAVTVTKSQASGVSGYALVGTPSITAIGNGWCQCVLTGTLGTAGTNYCYVGPVTTGTPTYGSSGIVNSTGTAPNGIFVWGASLYRSDLGGMQLNPAQPAGMQSYYPTTPRNLVGYSEDLSDAYWVKTGLLAFGSGSISNAIVGPNGLQTADFIVPSTGVVAHTLRSTTRTATATSYTASVYAKAGGYNFLGVQYVTDGYTKYYEGVFNLATGVVESTGRAVSYTGSRSITPVGNGWYRCSVTVTLSDAGVSSFVGFVVQQTNDPTVSFAGDGTSGIYLWGAQLSDSASLDAYSPVYGAAVTSAAYYAPRLDYSGSSLAALGLLVEEQRTNSFLYSTDLSRSATWLGPTGTGTFTGGFSAPDGTLTAFRYVPSTSAVNHDVIQTVTAAAVVYTMSIYAKEDSYSWLFMNYFDGTTDIGAYFNLSTGVPGNTSGSPAPIIVPVGGGWYRCSITFTGVVGRNNFGFSIVPSNGGRSAAGNGTSGAYLWGPQLDSVTGGNAPFMTSYIPTGASSATRTADVASVSTQAFPYSSTESTIVAAFSKFVTTQRGGVAALGASSTVTSNSLTIDAQNDAKMRAFSEVSGTYPYNNTDVGTYTANTAQKLAIAYAENNANAAANGSVGTTDTTAGLPVSIDLLQIGAIRNNTTAASTFLNGHIRQITYLPRRISNAELQSRTA